MKLFTLLLSSILSLSCLAGISLNIDFKNHENGKKIRFKKVIETYLDETSVIPIPNSKKVIEIKVTERIPGILVDETKKTKDQVLIDFKVVEFNHKNEKKVIASPKIISLIGEEASMETFEGKDRKKAKMSLKVIPNRL